MIIPFAIKGFRCLASVHCEGANEPKQAQEVVESTASKHCQVSREMRKRLYGNKSVVKGDEMRG